MYQRQFLAVSAVISDQKSLRTVRPQLYVDAGVDRSDTSTNRQSTKAYLTQMWICGVIKKSHWQFIAAQEH